MKLYAIIDKKAKDIVSIFPSISDQTASRSFVSLLSGAQSIFTDFPEDFALLACADVTVEGLSLKISRPGNEVVNKAGFNVDQFVIYDCLADGSEYSKAYLEKLHVERMNYGAIVPGIEVNSDERI